MNRVLETTEYVVENSEYVTINETAPVSFADAFDHKSSRHWLSAAPLDFLGYTDEEKLHFIFLLNAISFSYWGDPNWVVEYGGMRRNGAWGMILALRRAVQEGERILDFGHCSRMTCQDLARVLRADVPIPLLDERWRILHALGSMMIASYGGQASNLIAEAGGGALGLLEIILRRFASFGDSSVYRGKDVFFLKRAQLLVGDIYQLFDGQGYGALTDVDRLTACADYKLPRLLRRYGILEYADGLAAKIDRMIPIPHGSAEEVEIRANTIWAVERIRRQVQKRKKDILSIEINDHLWLATQEDSPDDRPYHRTRTTAY